MNNIFCSFHFSYRRSSQVSASAYPESGQSKRRQSVLQREKWQYLTWEVSLGSTNARPNCHKGVGPGRLQVLHHIRQVQGNGEHQGQEGVVLVSQATHLLLLLIHQVQGHRADQEHDGVVLVDEDAHLVLELIHP